MNYSIFFSFIICFALLSCKSEKKLSDLEQIEENAKNYLFLGDSIDVSVSISDTFHLEELEQMIAKTDENLFFIQNDIDTLGYMIDVLSYDILEAGGDVEINLKVNEEADITKEEHQLLIYYYKLEQLKAQSLSYSQTNRILFHLKRSIWADIAGFEVVLKYQLDSKPKETTLLVDADFKVVD